LASSSIMGMTGGFFMYFIFLCVSSTYAGVLFFREGCAPLFFVCASSSST
jgi:hypothetical protein